MRRTAWTGALSLGRAARTRKLASFRVGNEQTCGIASATSASAPKVVFSGIQPTGTPHLGNYVGALRQWVKLQDEPVTRSKLLFSVVDLHAMTLPQDASALRQRRRETFAALLAVGIDPDRSAIFYQSSVPAHSELMWILSCTASVGYLSRMTQWKAKMSMPSSATVLDDNAKSSLKLGLFAYPVLQAADILVHRATHVPVGDDQRQHLEFARECVSNFNHAYGPHLIAPTTLTTPACRIMSLQQPQQKMSKSHPNPRSRIHITDMPEDIEKKIMSAVTDSHNSVSYDPAARPGVSNLLDILSAFDWEGRSAAELATSMAGASLGSLKAQVAESVISHFSGIRKRYNDILSADDGKLLDFIEAAGAEKARANAEETMDIIRTATGL